MEELIRHLQSQAPAAPSGMAHAAYLFAHSILNGSVLMYLAWKVNHQSKARDSDLLMSSANVLFLCAGMTAVMILVADNIARAFAIGAAVALVRFKIKMAGKFLGVALFYAVLIGMACGVSRVDIAWTVTTTFGLILGAVSLLKRGLARKAGQRERVPLAIVPERGARGDEALGLSAIPSVAEARQRP